LDSYQSLQSTKMSNQQTLFLDRDGVINKRIEDGYVTAPHEFIFLDGVLSALTLLHPLFETIVLVTNQQGVGKGLMSAAAVESIHEAMLSEIAAHGGRIDACFYCPNLRGDNADCRKPKIGMAQQAKKQFPQINFEQSVIVGDSASDMEFGKNAGMTRVFIRTKPEDAADAQRVGYDFEFDSLLAFAKFWVYK
jgi:histidinol-phosphate phosphatase family protein